MQFKLTEEQTKKAKEWMAARAKYVGAAGRQFSFIFTPNSFGEIVKVTDGEETLDLTDTSTW